MTACRIAFAGAWRGARPGSAALTAPRRRPPACVHGRRPSPGTHRPARVAPPALCYPGKGFWEA